MTEAEIQEAVGIADADQTLECDPDCPSCKLGRALKHVLAERDEARKNYQFMVERAADQKLDGYRELGARAAAAEDETRHRLDHRQGPAFDWRGVMLTDDQVLARVRAAAEAVERASTAVANRRGHRIPEDDAFTMTARAALAMVEQLDWLQAAAIEANATAVHYQQRAASQGGAFAPASAGEHRYFAMAAAFDKTREMVLAALRRAVGE